MQVGQQVGQQVEQHCQYTSLTLTNQWYTVDASSLKNHLRIKPRYLAKHSHTKKFLLSACYFLEGNSLCIEGLSRKPIKILPMIQQMYAVVLLGSSAFFSQSWNAFNVCFNFYNTSHIVTIEFKIIIQRNSEIYWYFSEHSTKLLHKLRLPKSTKSSYILC